MIHTKAQLNTHNTTKNEPLLTRIGQWFVMFAFAFNGLIGKPLLGAIRLAIYAFQIPSSRWQFKTIIALFTLLTLLTLPVLALALMRNSGDSELHIIALLFGLASISHFQLCATTSLSGNSATDKTGMFLGLSVFTSGAFGALMLQHITLLFEQDNTPLVSLIGLFTGLYALFSLFILLQCWGLPMSWRFTRTSLSFSSLSLFISPLFRHFPFVDAHLISVINEKQETTLKKHLLRNINVRQAKHLLHLLNNKDDRRIVDMTCSIDNTAAQRQFLLAAFTSERYFLAAEIVNRCSIQATWWMEKDCKAWLTLFHGTLEDRINAAVNNLNQPNENQTPLSLDERVLFAVRFYNLTPLELLPYAPAHYHGAILHLMK